MRLLSLAMSMLGVLMHWYSGNLLAIAGTTLVLIALTWGGIQFPWGSAHVLAPLIIGAALLVVFLFYEKLVPREPAIPLDILANRTSLCGYVTLVTVSPCS